MAKKKIQPDKNERIIHVKAESRFVSLNALIPERKVLSVLKKIKLTFLKRPPRFDPKHDDKLKVQTCVHNPTFF